MDSGIKQIEEYTYHDFDNIDKEIDLPYLRKPCFRFSEARNSPYRLIELKDNKVRIENTSYSGIIQLENIRIHFSTKVRTNLFYMLSFLRDEKSFCCDMGRIIEIREGPNFYDILGRLYLNELQEIFKRGFYKKYVKKSEDLSFLRGRIDLKEQLYNILYKRPKIHCRYDDLTYDNQENRIILAATTLLIPQISPQNNSLRSGLMRKRNLMRDEVTLTNVAPEDCDRIQYSRINEYYRTIIQFSKAVLQSYFIRSVHKGAAKGFNFIVDMNKVYEDFITEIVQELVKEDKIFDGYEVLAQERINSLVRENKLVAKPDIIIKKKRSKEMPLILDAKYKKQDNNADYYQVIAYALAVPGAKAGFLIYPDSEQVEASVFTIDPRLLGSIREEIKLHTLKINLLLSEKMTFKDYMAAMKDQLRDQLSACDYLKNHAAP